MRKIIFIVFLSLLLVSVAYADQFQMLVDKKTGAYVAYAPVYVGKSLIGHTDKYGRITINLPRGEHRCKVEYRGERKSVEINITDSIELKVVYLDD